MRVQVEEDLLLLATSWLDLWMGREALPHVDAVRDVSGFDTTFRNFQNPGSENATVQPG